MWRPEACLDYAAGEWAHRGEHDRQQQRLR
jgi:hypothetical protein